MLRILSVTVIIISGALIGLSASQRVIMRASFFEQAVGFLTDLQTQMRFCGDSLPVLLRTGSGKLLQPLLEVCAQGMESGASFFEAWQNALMQLPHSMGLSKEDIRLLTDFGQGVGTTAVEGQLAHCELYKTMFSSRLKQAREEKEKKVKLYRMLGLFSGVAVSLLIL